MHRRFFAAVSVLALLLSGCGNGSTQPDAAGLEQNAEQSTVSDAALSDTDSEGRSASIEVNGISLYYEVKGKGKPVILVSANGGDHTTLSVERDQLIAAGYQVYTLDTRGQGNSTEVEEYHYTDMAEDIYQFIQQLNLQKPAYYGWSDGGIIGLLLATQHPDLFSVLAVSGANLNPDGADPENGTVQDVKSDWQETGDPLLGLLFLEPDIKPEALKAVTIPVLVTAGSNDLILEEHTRLIADSLPNAELKIVEGENHQSYIYQSEIMGDLLIAFLKKNNY